jgi:hypothetical protein
MPHFSTRGWCSGATEKYEKDHDENEHVVDREGFLDQIAGEELHGLLGAENKNRSRPRTTSDTATQTRLQRAASFIPTAWDFFCPTARSM